jgi:hypothetical protein
MIMGLVSMMDFVLEINNKKSDTRDYNGVKTTH